MATRKQKQKPKGTKGIFVDNDPEFRKDVASHCKGFRVLEIDQTPRGEAFGLELDSDDYDAFLKGLSGKGKAAASVLKVFLEREGIHEESYDPRSGITETHVHELKEWVIQNRQSKILGVFDFDRTLTMMEGGHFVGTSLPTWKETMKHSLHESERHILDGFTAEGFAEYLAGGAKRLAMLQDMFDFLYKNSVKCFLLTNNSACMDSRGLLKELVHVYTKNRPIKIVCGLEYGGQKSLAIRSNTKARKFLCSAQTRKERQNQ
jgi:hypothetical protein